MTCKFCPPPSPSKHREKYESKRYLFYHSPFWFFVPLGKPVLTKSRCLVCYIQLVTFCLTRNNCDCFVNNASCQCVNTSREHLLSTTAKFSVISAIICTPDGVLHIADQVIFHVFFTFSNYYL